MRRPPSRAAWHPDIVGRVFESLDALRDVRALGLLVGTFGVAGLLLSMAQTALLRGTGGVWAALQAAIALTVTFYGANATGLMLMDDARGVARREPAAALRDALRCAHRLLFVLVATLAVGAALLALVAGVMWLSRPSIAGRWIGPLLFGAALPAAALVLGLALLALVTVVAPLAAPAVWSGADTATVLRQLGRLTRHRLADCVLLTGAVSLLAAAVAAMCTFVVAGGVRAAVELAVVAAGIDLPAPQLMAGFFGRGMRAPGAASSYGAAAQVGGGVVFAMALVLPGLVYLRGVCAVYLALRLDD